MIQAWWTALFGRGGRKAFLPLRPGGKQGPQASGGGDGRARPAFSIARSLVVAFAAMASLSAWAAADLVLNHSDTPDPGPAGGIFTYTLRIDNNGPDPATGITLTDLLPPGSQFISATPSTGTCPTQPAVGSDGSVACSLGNLPFTSPVTSSVNVVIQLRLPTAGVWVNTATAGAATPDQNTANNINVANPTTAVDAADLAVVATPSVVNVAAGQTYTYTVASSNNGPNALPGDATQFISFTVPAGAAITTQPTGAGWSCTPASGSFPLTSGIVSCFRSGPLAAGAAAPALTVQAVTNVAGNVTVAFATGATKNDGSAMPDGNLANNTSNATVTSTAGSDVQIVKTAAPATVGVGSQVTYTLTPRLNGGISPVASGGAITVIDTLGPGLTFDSAAGTGWTCSAAGQVVTCTRPGPFAGNFTNMPTITIMATAASAGALSNSAAIDIPDFDPVPGNNVSTVGVTASNDADLRMNKSASLNPLVPNQAFNYSLSATNLGVLGIPAGQTISVTDTLPANVTITGAVTGTGWTCGVAGQTVTCTRPGPLNVNANTPAITIPARLTAAGTATNNACVSLVGAGRVDPVAANNCFGVTSTASGTEADLSIVKSVAAPSVVAGQNLTYTMVVTNAGPAPSTNVTLTDNLQSLVATGSLQSATPSQGTCTPAAPANGTTINLSCNFGTLNAGASANVVVVIRPSIAFTGTRVNVADVTSPQIGDPNRANNSSSVSSSVTAIVDVTVQKTATPATVPAGAPLTFVTTVRNQGPSTAQTVTMSDVLPANAAFIDLIAVTGGGTCAAPAAGTVGGNMNCSWATINNNTQQTVSYRMRPLGSAAGGTVTNSVAVATVTPETSLLNNTATTSTPVTTPQLDINVNKTDSVDPVDLGQTTTYTIRINNTGPSYGTNVVMTDVFPAPASVPTAVFSYQGALTVDTGGTCTQPAIGATAGTLSCTFPGLASGQTANVTYVMRAESLTVVGANSGTAFNDVAVRVNEPETTMANNSVTEATTARRNVVATDLGITKTVDRATATPGQALVYTLTVVNNGPAASVGAQLVDTVPAGMTVASAPGCVIAGATVTCPVGALAVGASRAFVVNATINTPYGGAPALTNTGVVDAPGDTNPANNSATAVTTVAGGGGVTAVPSLSTWALILLAMAVAVAGVGQGRRSRN